MEDIYNHKTLVQRLIYSLNLKFWLLSIAYTWIPNSYAWQIRVSRLNMIASYLSKPATMMPNLSYSLDITVLSWFSFVLFPLLTNSYSSCRTNIQLNKNCWLYLAISNAATSLQTVNSPPLDCYSTHLICPLVSMYHIAVRRISFQNIEQNMSLFFLRSSNGSSVFYGLWDLRMQALTTCPTILIHST